MLPTIATGNVASALAGEYEVANSLRFNSGSSDNLTKTDSSGSSRRIFTYSVWVKRVKLSKTNADMIVNNASNESNQFKIELEGSSSGDDHDIRIRQLSSGTQNINIKTSATFRDVSAWYHIVVAVDTTQSTDSNRVKLYVNGSQITAFDSSTYPSQDSDMEVNVSSSYTTHIGKRNNNDHHFDGYMCEFVFIDGSALAPTSFGEFDEDTNIWKPKDVSGLTFGNNGFYLDFENSGSLGADVSGNGNNFTVNNLTSIDQTTDTCTNNYCTLSQLWNFNGNFTLSDGNLNFIGTGNNDGTAGTMGVSSGKWYFEAEFDTNSSACYAGWGDAELLNTTGTGNPNTVFIGMYRDDYTIQIGGGSVTTYTTVSDGDIFGFAINLDASSGSKTVIVQKNGSTIDTITIPTANENNFFIPVCGDTSSTDGRLKFNFGNPFETLSSGNSDANGYGNFEYSPTINSVNYYALNTKNLAEYG